MNQTVARYFDTWFAVDQVFGSAAFREDADLLVSIPSAEFDTGLSAIATENEDFIGFGKLKHALSAVSDDDQRRAFAQFVSTLTRWRLTIGDPLDKFVEKATDRLADQIDENDPSKQLLIARVAQICRLDNPGVSLAHKAERVATSLGSELINLQLISDLRPIFDENRDRVCGLIPVTTLRITAHEREHIETTTLEVRLTEKELTSLQKSVVEASKKLQTLKEFLANQTIKIPDSELTEAVSLMVGDQ